MFVRFICSLIGLSLIHISPVQACASEKKDAPFYGSLTGSIGAAWGWWQKQTGTKPVSYCTNEHARHLYNQTERMLELRFATERTKKNTKTYVDLMQDGTFCNFLKQLNDRAYFDWQHMLDAIANNRYRDVHNFYKYNRVNASPCLRIAAWLYLQQNKNERDIQPQRKRTNMRFQLSLDEPDHGYLESSVPHIPEHDQDFPTLRSTIRNKRDKLSIASPGQAAERRVRKSLGGTFSDAYLKSAQEVEKSQAVYAVYFARLFATYKVNNSIIELFQDETFQALYNQVWDRDWHLRARLQDQLTRGSLDACLLYDHHRKNICPIFAALVCDMILSNEKTYEVPRRLQKLYDGGEKPYGKIIFMFLNSLKKDQKRILLNAKDDILQTPSQDFSAAIHGKIKANDGQLELLAELQGGNQIAAMFEKLEGSCIRLDETSPVSSGDQSATLLTPPIADTAQDDTKTEHSPTVAMMRSEISDEYSDETSDKYSDESEGSLSKLFAGSSSDSSDE